jgi:transcriptional regulator with XRE-family HTH domain
MRRKKTDGHAETSTPKLKDAREQRIPVLQHYDDYRDYIKDRIAIERERNPRLSFEYFARRFHLSTSFLSMLLSKKKHLSVDTLSAVSEFFKLNETDRMYLVFTLLEQTAKDKAQTKYFKSLRLRSRGLMHLRKNQEEVEMDAVKDIYASELTLILDALVRTNDFVEDADWVMASLRDRPESKEEVMKALQVVMAARKKLKLEKKQSLDMDFLVVNGTGLLFEGAFKIHGRAIENPSAVKPYLFGAGAYVMTSESYVEARHELKKFGMKLKELEERDGSGDTVVIFNSALITAARTPK